MNKPSRAKPFAETYQVFSRIALCGVGGADMHRTVAFEETQRKIKCFAIDQTAWQVCARAVLLGGDYTFDTRNITLLCLGCLLKGP